MAPVNGLNSNGTELFETLSFQTKTTVKIAPAEKPVTSYNKTDEDQTENLAEGKASQTGINFVDNSEELPPTPPEENSDDDLTPLLEIEAGNPNPLEEEPNINEDEAKVLSDPEILVDEVTRNHSIGKAVITAENALVTSSGERILTSVVKNATEKEVVKALNEVTIKSKEGLKAKGLTKIGEDFAKGAARKTTVEFVDKSAIGALRAGTETGTKTTLKALEETGKLGKGVVSQTGFSGIKAVAKSEGGIVKGLTKSGQEATEVIVKTIGEKGVIKGSADIMSKTSVGVGEKILQKGIESGAKSGVEKVITKGGE